MLRRDFLQLSGVPFLSVPPSGKPPVSCILLNLTGGPAHLDTWDMKPDAPREIRGHFRPIKTNVPGIEISEIFPRMARHADKFALIRSVYHDGPALHETGLELTQTGGSADLPHVGDLVAAAAGSRHVVMGGGLSRFAANCVRARRLVQAGTRFVSVNMADSVFGEVTWDSHGSAPFSSVADYAKSVAPVFDAAYSSLLEGLDRRGMLPTTLVVGMGEFGRTPRINPVGGRDHWPACWTVHMAGGGVRGGQVYGSSDKTGSEPRDSAVHASRLAATICSAIGIEFQHAAPVREIFG